MRIAIAALLGLLVLPLSPFPVADMAAAQAGSARPMVTVTGEVLARALGSNPTPQYPAIAQAAQVEGVVFVRVVISSEGFVERADIERGHPMLDMAALQTVSQWRFAPAGLTGPAAQQESTLMVSFFLRPAADLIPALQVLAAQVARCEELGRSGAFAEAIAHCQSVTANPVVVRARADAEFQRRTRLALAGALPGAGRHGEAVGVFEQTLESTRSNHARRVALRGLVDAHVGLGDIRAAADACEDLERVTRADAPAPSETALRARFVGAFRTVLLQCAVIYAKAGKTSDADKARKRAAELK
jgi:TonB family protein